MDIKTSNIKEKLDTVNNQFFAALDDFTKYYVYVNKNPEVNEFQNFYSNSRGQLQSLTKDVFLINNDIEHQISEVNNNVQSISDKLIDEKELNVELTNLLSNLENTQNGSVILISDSKKLYNKQYVKNMELLVGILIASMVLRVVFKK
jgi:hypothetical protein